MVRIDERIGSRIAWGQKLEPLPDDDTVPRACGQCGSRSLFADRVEPYLDYACLMCGWRTTTRSERARQRIADMHRLTEAERHPKRGRPPKVRL